MYAVINFLTSSMDMLFWKLGPVHSKFWNLAPHLSLAFIKVGYIGDTVYLVHVTHQ